MLTKVALKDNSVQSTTRYRKAAALVAKEHGKATPSKPRGPRKYNRSKPVNEAAPATPCETGRTSKRKQQVAAADDFDPAARPRPRKRPSTSHGQAGLPTPPATSPRQYTFANVVGCTETPINEPLFYESDHDLRTMVTDNRGLLAGRVSLSCRPTPFSGHASSFPPPLAISSSNSLRAPSLVAYSSPSSPHFQYPLSLSTSSPSTRQGTPVSFHTHTPVTFA